MAAQGDDSLLLSRSGLVLGVRKVLKAHSIQGRTVSDMEAPKGGQFDRDHVHGVMESVSLYDCPMWTDEATKSLQMQYPGTKVHVETCTGSLSGYVIHFHRMRQTIEWGWFAFIGAEIACCLFILQKWMIDLEAAS